MSKLCCNHCGDVIIDTPSESGPSVVRDGDNVFCNTFCYAGKKDRVKPKLNPLAVSVGFLGGGRVTDLIRSTINKVNKGKRS